MRRAAGSLRQRTPGVWLVTVSAGNDPNTGARRRVTTTVRGTRVDAERALAVALVGTGRDGPDTHDMTVASYLVDLWLPHAAGHVRYRTHDEYSRKVNRHVLPYLGGYRLDGLSALMCDRWLADLARAGVGPATRLGCYRVLAVALHQAVRWRLVERDPLAAVTPPRPPAHEPTVLTLVQARVLVAAADGTPLAPLIAVALGGGLRRSEACGLTWADVDLDAGRVRVERGLHQRKGGVFLEPPKTDRSRRTVTLPAWAVELLKATRGLGAAPLIPDPDDPGKPWSPSEVTRAFRELADSAGLAVPLRDLRHSAATLALAAGVDVAIVSRHLGHSNVSTTDRFYLRPGADLDKAAAAAVDALYRDAR